MKKLILALALCLSLNAYAKPDAVTDPVDPATVNCAWYLDTATKEVLPVVVISPTVKVCKRDVSMYPTGTHTLAVSAMTVNDPVWGTQESAKSIPITFTRPGTPNVPTGLLITP